MIRVIFICHGISIHALFAEGDHFVIFNHSLIIEISIHALFAEGDELFRFINGGREISIHALFAEGDQ